MIALPVKWEEPEASFIVSNSSMCGNQMEIKEEGKLRSSRTLRMELAFGSVIPPHRPIKAANIRSKTLLPATNWFLACERGCEFQRKLDKTSQEKIWSPAHLRCGQAQVGQAPEQRRKDYLEFDARQWPTQAVMRTMTECHDLLFFRTLNIEHVWTGEMALVEVRGC